MTPPVVALSVDLMDRSKIAAALPDATLVRSMAKLIDAATPGALVLIDLGRVDDVAVFKEIDARIIAFGSHVKPDLLAAAESAGAEALPRSVFFRRLASGDL